MASKGSPNSLEAPTKQQGMLLPNIPKLTDDKSRIKYMTDYDKYEAELHKHHLGPSTQTAGLKSIATDFDRRVPALDEPMDVDRNYTATGGKRKQQKKTTTTTTTSRPVSRPASPPPPLTDRSSQSKVVEEGETFPSAPSVQLHSTAILSTTEPPTAAADTSSVGAAPTAALTKRSTHNTNNSNTATAAVEQDKSQPIGKGEKLRRNQREKESKEGRSQSVPLTDTVKEPSDKSSMKGAAGKGRSGRKAGTARSISDPPLRSTAPLTSSIDPRTKFSEAARELALPRGDTDTKAPLRGVRGENEVEDCAELLRLLVTPPYEYADAFLLELDGIDLNWLAGRSQRPSALTSLEQISINKTGSLPTISSPRSVLVCLRNGVSIADLRPTVSSDPLPNEANVREAVQQFRSERDIQRRERLLRLLLTDYRELCGKVDLERLITAFHNPPPPKALSDPPTSLLQRQERQRRVFETNKIRMEKHLEYTKEVHQRRLEAEARLLEAEEEARLALEEKKRKEMEEKALQEQRLELQKQKNKEKEEFFKRQLEERLALAEEKNKQREEAQERLAEIRRANREAKEEERLRRLERNAEVQRQQAELLEEKRKEKEEKLERLAEERQRRLEAEHEEMLIRQEKAARAREDARRRAEEEDQRIREAALARQLEVEKRLEEFERERQAKRITKAQEEEEKEHKRELARLKAEQKEAEFKANVLRAQAEHDAAYAETQRQRALENALRKEQEREEIEEKLFAVQKKKRVDEFRKLRTTADLLEKRKAAEAVEEQRNLIHQKMMNERKILDEEKEKLKQQIAQQQID